MIRGDLGRQIQVGSVPTQIKTPTNHIRQKYGLAPGLSHGDANERLL